jgi:hypothetical protein
MMSTTKMAQMTDQRRGRVLCGRGAQKVKDETTYGLSPERLARLLAMGLQDSDAMESPGAGRPPGEVLQDMLSRELPLDPTISDSVPAVLNRPCNELLPTGGSTIRDLLLSSKTDLAVIKTVKDYGKQLARRGGSEAAQAAVTVFYYSAIASALAFHQHKISQHSYQKLDKAFTELEQKPWVSPELKGLFEKAQAICRQRKKGAG